MLPPRDRGRDGKDWERCEVQNGGKTKGLTGNRGRRVIEEREKIIDDGKKDGCKRRESWI